MPQDPQYPENPRILETLALEAAPLIHVLIWGDMGEHGGTWGNMGEPLVND